jgi:hypothetical protein
MFLLNLSLPEFLALFAAVSGVVVTLYLLSRARRRQTVPTLRFWVHARQPVPSSRRRKIQQPWSLILQLLGLALLLLAIAQLRLGNRETSQRDHVLLLDASSWMGARNSGSGMLLDEAKAKARAFIRSLPGSDRVMVVRVDSLPSPVTGMVSSREMLERAINETRPGASALNLDQAFLFAEQIQRLHRSSGGEVVFAGAGRVSAAGVPGTVPANLRVLAVDSPAENCGITGIGARRSDTTPGIWDVFVAVHNYGVAPKRVPVTAQFGGAPAGSALLDVKGNSTESYTFHYRTRAAGWIEARLLLSDSLTDDNRAILELPELKVLNVAVYTSEPEAIRPVLSANPQVKASYYSPAEYRPDNGAEVIIVDRFAPAPEPKTATIYLEPPESSPFRTRTQFSEPRLLRWRSEHEITAGIRARDSRIPSGQILAAAKNDVVLAEVDGGPVALVRPDRKFVALGFHPGRTNLKFDLTTPLLLANVLRWMKPDVFRVSEVHGSSVGSVTASLDRIADSSRVRVLADGQELPYTLSGNNVRFFSGAPGVVRVLTGDREQVYSLSLPEVGEREWTAPQSARRGVPGLFAQAVSRDLWHILAILGAACLLAEWLIFGRRRETSVQSGGRTAPPGPGFWRKAS